MIPGSRFVILSITLVLTTAAVAEKTPFRAATAESYPHQTSDQVTVGAKSFNTEELTQQAFGKADLLKYGVLPVLVVIKNDRKRTLSLQNLEVNLVGVDGSHVTQVAPEDIPYLSSKPKRSEVPLPKLPMPKKKNPLSGPEIIERAFAARMLPPGDSASGFFYFEAKPEAGDKLYLNGLRDTPSGQEILYFEFEIDR